MTKKKTPNIEFSYLIPAIIAICLIAVAISIIIIYTDSEKNSNIIQNAISLSTLILTGITLVFLYLTLNQQQEQIDSNKSDVEFNRVLDLIYKNVEYTKKDFDILSEATLYVDSSIQSRWTIENYLQKFFDLNEDKFKHDKLGDLFNKRHKMVDYYIKYKGRLGVYVSRFSTIVGIYQKLIIENDSLKGESKEILYFLINGLFYRDAVYVIVRYHTFLKTNLEIIKGDLMDYYKNDVEAVKTTLDSVNNLSKRMSELEGFFKHK